MLHFNGCFQCVQGIGKIDHDRIAHFLNERSTIIFDDGDSDPVMFSEHFTALYITMGLKVLCGTDNIGEQYGDVVHRTRQDASLQRTRQSFSRVYLLRSFVNS